MSDTDDPFKPSDATVLRPRPGAGRRGASEATSVSRTAAVSQPPARIDAIAPGDAEFLGKGLSPLVQAASSLLFPHQMSSR